MSTHAVSLHRVFKSTPDRVYRAFTTAGPGPGPVQPVHVASLLMAYPGPIPACACHAGNGNITRLAPATPSSAPGYAGGFPALPIRR
jgi:hypothetical protein